MEKLTSAQQDTEAYPFAVEVAAESGQTDTYLLESASQVLDMVIDGDYLHLPDEQALVAQAVFAGAYAAPVVQQAIIDGALAEGEELDGEVVDALMDQDEQMVAGSVWPDEAPPKVIVSTDFGGDTGLERPTGNVVSLDPEDELTFIRQLGQLGLIRLHEKAPDAAE